MVEFQQHLTKKGAISANGDKSEIEWFDSIKQKKLSVATLYTKSSKHRQKVEI